MRTTKTATKTLTTSTKAKATTTMNLQNSWRGTKQSYLMMKMTMNTQPMRSCTKKELQECVEVIQSKTKPQKNKLSKNPHRIYEGVLDKEHQELS